MGVFKRNCKRETGTTLISATVAKKKLLAERGGDTTMVGDVSDIAEVTALTTAQNSAPCAVSAVWSAILEQILEQV